MATARFHTAASSASTRLDSISQVADACGVPLLPWVERAVAVTTEHEDGEPLRRIATWTVPRQAGKSVAQQVIAIEAMLRKPDQFGVYMAQNRLAATNRLKGLAKLLQVSGLDPGHRATFGVGNERMVFGNGSVLQVLPPTENAAHGESLDLIILDEVFAIDPIVMQGLTPAMSARPEAQLIAVSTQGTLANSHLLNELTAQGREDPDSMEMAYVEYSCPDDVHPLDEAYWPDYHPGIEGGTTTMKHLRSEAKRMRLGDFARAYGNRATAQETDAIPAEWWERSGAARPIPDRISLSVDSSSLGAGIAAAFTIDDGWHADLVEHRAGEDLKWIVPRLRGLMADREVPILVMDAGGPISTLRPELQALCEDQGVAFRQLSQADRARADQHLYDLLRESSLTHGQLEALDESVASVGTQAAGDLWRFSRKRSVGDPSPIIALSEAAWGAYEVEELMPSPAFHVV